MVQIRNSLLLKLITFGISVLLFFYSSFIMVTLMSADISLFAMEKRNATDSSSSATPRDIFSQDRNQQLEQSRSNEIEIPTSERKLAEFIDSEWINITIPVFSFFFILIGIIYLAISLGWNEGNEVPQFMYIHIFPLDIFLSAFVYLLFGIRHISQSLTISLQDTVYSIFPQYQLIIAALWSLIFISAYSLLLLLIAQIKAGTLFTKLLITKMIIFVWKLLKNYFQSLKKQFFSLKNNTKHILIIFVYLLLNLLLIFGIIKFPQFRIVLSCLCVVLNIIFGVISSKYVNSFETIKKSIVHMSKGNFESIDTTEVNEDLSEVALSIQKLNQNIHKAIDAKTKSELFKTELITNVSHDIKTPLTSIIMYTDLLKREKTDNPNIQNYIDVLSKQSNRLKTLVENLLEVSKISTGNIQLQLISLNLNEFLYQIFAEYQPKFEAQNLTLVFTSPKEDYFIKADPQLLIRVFDNLFTNILKYAEENTHVYLDVLTHEIETIQIRLRNVSASKIEMSAEQLMERFVQGDISRSSGGSGIGLSISKSLVEAQNGSFSIKIDDDLFTVYLTIQKSFSLSK